MILWITDQTTSYRIEMNVENQSIEVVLPLVLEPGTSKYLNFLRF